VPGSWVEPNSADIDTNYNVTGVSCVPSGTETFCAAVDSGGRIEGSKATTPFSGTIHGAKQLTIGPLDAVSCTSNTFCMAVTAEPSGSDLAAKYDHGAGTKVLYSTNLTGDLDGVSCWSTNCMAVNTSGDTFLFTSGSWTQEGSVSGTPAGISCDSNGDCYIDSGGTIYSTMNDTSWASTGISVGNPPGTETGNTPLSCVSSCQTINNSAPSGNQVTVYAIISGTKTAGTVTSITSPLISVSCESGSTCTAVDGVATGAGHDNAFSTTDNFVTTHSGTVVGPNENSGVAPTSIGCSTTLCVVGMSEDLKGPEIRRSGLTS
jgi:hypothetical protein